MALTWKEEMVLRRKEDEGYDTATQRTWLEGGRKGEMPAPVWRNPAAHRSFKSEPADAIMAAINEGKQGLESNPAYEQSLTNNSLTRTLAGIPSAVSGYVKDAGETLGTAAGEFVQHPGSSLKQGVRGAFEGLGMDISGVPDDYPPDLKAKILANQQRLEEEAPSSRHLGQMGMQAFAGSRIGAAVGPALGAAAAGAELPGVALPAGAAARMAAARTAAAAGTGGIAAGGTAALSGGDVPNAVADGMFGGAALHVATAPVTRAAGMLAEHIRSPRTQLGRGVRATESLYGPDAVGVRVKGAPGLDEGERGIAQLGRRSAPELQDIGEGWKAQAGAEYDQVLKARADKRADPTLLHAGLDEAIAETTTENGVVLRPDLRKKLELAKRAIDQEAAPLSSSSAPTLRPGDGVSIRDILKTKKMLDAEANWGMPATPEQAQIRKIATALAKTISKVDPELGAAQAKYAQAMTDLEQYNEGLYGKDDPTVPDTAAMRKRLATRLGQQGLGQGASSQGHTELELEEVRKRYPGKISDLIDAPTAERFRQDVSIGAPRVIVSSEGKPVARSNLSAFHDIATARGVYPAAKAAAKPRPGAGAALIEAAEAERERRKKKHAP